MCFQEFRHQQVRDLAVSCFGEPLISDFTAFGGPDSPSHCALQLTEKRKQWLQQLDRNPVLLVNFLEQKKSRRLGFYHEALWQFFLQQDDEVELLASNCQLQQAGKTIGEFDVIYRDLQRDQVVHLELAFKVYLLSPHQPATDLSQWLGPNLNDRLDLKLDHMLNHQSRLSLTAAGKEKLFELGIDEVNREISMRGYLLQNRLADKQESALNPNHLTGDWLPLSKAIELLQEFNWWASLSNLQWISPVNGPQHQVEAKQFSHYLLQHFEQFQSPLMLCASHEPLLDNTMEGYRLMVTPENWPNCDDD